MLFLDDFLRVEGPHHTPSPEAAVLDRLLRLLALTPAGQAPAGVIPQPGDSVNDLLTQGWALEAQERLTDVLYFFQRATEQAPKDVAAWTGRASVLHDLCRYEEALTTYDRALAITPTDANI